MIEKRLEQIKAVHEIAPERGSDSDRCVFHPIFPCSARLGSHDISWRSFLEIGATASGGLMLSLSLPSPNGNAFIGIGGNRQMEIVATAHAKDQPLRFTVIVSTAFHSRPINTKSLRTIFLASYDQRR
jgi:hypothetical protein